MATIKKMAEEEFPISRWEEMRSANDCRKLFCIGANAVLEEIKSIIQYDKGDDRPWLLRGNQLYDEIQKKIKELKCE